MEALRRGDDPYKHEVIERILGQAFGRNQTSEKALDKWEKLKQTGTLEELIEDFRSSLGDIDEEYTPSIPLQILHLLKALKPGLRRQMVNPTYKNGKFTDVDSLIDFAMTLDDIDKETDDGKTREEPWTKVTGQGTKRKPFDKADAGGQKEGERVKGRYTKADMKHGRPKLSHSQMQALRDSNKCFICEEVGHRASECSRKGKTEKNDVKTVKA